MTGGHNLIRLYALVICDREMSRTLILCLKFPIVTTTLCGQLAGRNQGSSPPQFVIILHCHGCPCLSNTYISSALWRQCKNKITAHLPFSSQPPPPPHRQKIYCSQTQNMTSADIYFSIYFQVHSHPITSFSF